MELPHLGKHCSKSECNKLDFLPIKCDACRGMFCEAHYSYTAHNCISAYKRDNQVPVCPLCNIPIPVQKGQHPDAVVGSHIDSDCQSDPAKSRRKIFTNQCSYKRCKTKEVVPVICKECSRNFCLKHRHTADHNCAGKSVHNTRWIFEAQSSSSNVRLQGNISEDEALARALAMSMQSYVDPKEQEELDLALARQLQASEAQTTAPSDRNSRDRCNVS